MEELEARHRRERKELIATVTGLKKSVTKGEKQKKKQVQAEVALLEHELETRHEKERRELTEQAKDQVDTLAQRVEQSSIADCSVEKKASRQKQRQLKKKCEMEASLEQARVEAKSMKNMKEIERERIEERLLEQKLKLVDIAADGHCLYRAVSHQAKTVLGVELNFSELRMQTASYLADHQEQFAPFLTTDDGDFMDSDSIFKYCADIRDTATWGGDVELQILSAILEAPIKVILMDGEIRAYNEHFPEKNTLWLSYHKHYYALGAHYNSLVSVQA